MMMKVHKNSEPVKNNIPYIFDRLLNRKPDDRLYFHIGHGGLNRDCQITLLKK